MYTMIFLVALVLGMYLSMTYYSRMYDSVSKLDMLLYRVMFPADWHAIVDMHESEYDVVSNDTSRAYIGNYVSKHMWVNPRIGKHAMRAIQGALPISKHAIVFQTKSGIII